MTPRILLALLAFAPLPLLAQARRPVARPFSDIAADVCRGVPFPNAPAYDTSREGTHKLAEPGRPRDSRAYARWYAQQRSELELVLCFASEEVVVDTCRGYRTVGFGDRASDVVLAKRRWSVRLLETRTGLVVGRLQLQVEGAPACPRSVAAPVTYFVVEADGPEESATLWDWVSRFVEPRSPSATLRRACDGGYMEACVDLGAMYAEGRGAAQSDTRAVVFYQRAVFLYLRACDTGIMQGCAASLGVAYDDRRGVAQNPTRVVELYQQVCDAGIMQGCASLGVAYDNGRGVAQNPTRAVELYQRVCDAGIMRGCAGLGVAYAEGRGVAQNLTRAVELHQRACDGGDMEGCANLGAMHAAGRGVPESDTRAVEFYRRACNGGFQAACDWLPSRSPGTRP